MTTELLKQSLGVINNMLEAQSNPAWPVVCRWTPMDDEFNPGSYDTSCGRSWSFAEGGIKENDMTFCFGCGKTVFEVAPDAFASTGNPISVPEGWVMVPREPTQEMLNHADKVVPAVFSIGDEYRAIIEAAQGHI